jgi:hypothetical protein
VQPGSSLRSRHGLGVYFVIFLQVWGEAHLLLEQLEVSSPCPKRMEKILFMT